MAASEELTFLLIKSNYSSNQIIALFVIITLFCVLSSIRKDDQEKLIFGA